ncbi:MAG: DinB family protein [Bacteroidota bacterium]
MNEKHNNFLDQLDKDFAFLLEELKVYSDDQLNRKPSPEQWSVIQVMHHLMLSESLSLKYINKKLSFNPTLKKAGIKARMRLLLLKGYMASPFKAKAPGVISGEQLPEFATFWDTAKRWKQQRQELRQFLSELPKDILNKEVYKHPFAGRMSIDGMLGFFQAHFNRHHKQIQRVLKPMIPVGGNVKV